MNNTIEKTAARQACYHLTHDRGRSPAEAVILSIAHLDVTTSVKDKKKLHFPFGFNGLALHRDQKPPTSIPIFFPAPFSKQRTPLLQCWPSGIIYTCTSFIIPRGFKRQIHGLLLLRWPFSASLGLAVRSCPLSVMGWSMSVDA